MKSIEFYDLARPAQERFVAATRATLAPAPLAVRLATRFVGARWFLAAGVGTLSTAALVGQGFGDLESAYALASGWRALAYCVGFTVSFGCLTGGLTLRDRALSLPFARGVYLFPSGVVEAMGSELTVHSLNSLKSVNATGTALEVTFDDGKKYIFPAEAQEIANAAAAAVGESQARLGEATAAESVRHLAALDPLCYTDHPSPFSQNIPFKRPTTLWSVALLIMAAVSGSALGVGLWQVRNTMSESRLIEAATEINTTSAFRSYLARGGTKLEIIDTLLPRAELAEAQAVGTVESIESYIASHADSKISEEVNRALKQALLEALAKAAQPGTLAALNEFSTKHSSHQPVAKELASARHAVYEKAAKAAADAAVSTRRSRSNAAGFLRRLVAYTEKHTPEVEIRFRAQLGKSAQRGDIAVRRSPYFGGNRTLPSRHFRSKAMRGREKLTGQSLVAALQPLFPPEIVHFSIGKPLATLDPSESDRSFPEVEAPTMFIDHRTELSGGTVNMKPRGIFLSAGIFFETTFVIPGDESKLTHSVSTWRTPSRRIMRLKKRSSKNIYEDLARRSFSQFLRRFLPRLLVSPPDVPLPELDLPQPDDSKSR